MTRSTWIRLGIGLAGLALVLGILFSLRRPTAVADRKPDLRDAPVLDGKLIRFSESFAKRAELTAVPVKLGSLTPVVAVTGTVAFDPRQFAAVGVRISGRVRRIFKFVGDKVAPHTPLAEVESAELGRAEALLTGARAKELAAEADMKREKSLAAAKISSEREAEMAHAVYESAKAERIAAEHAVKALGGEPGGEIGVLAIRSPIAGKIVTSKISRGQTVNPSDTAFEIADLGSVWLELRVFERDLVAIRNGDAVEVLTQYQPDKPIRGKVAHVGDLVDPQTRSAPVRVVVDNTSGGLRPGQSVSARIHTTAPAAPALIVPRASVTRVDGKPTVFVLLDRAVEPRTVELGPTDRESIEITSGVQQGEQVVLGGLLAIKSEIFR